jgi:two-component system, NarL family, response regulator DesR
LIHSEAAETAVTGQRWPGAADARAGRGAAVAPRRAIRVAVADRRRLIADALAVAISSREELTVTGVIDTGNWQPVAGRPPDVVLVGIGADRAAGLDLVCQLETRMPSVKILLHAESLDPELVSFVLDHALGGLLLTDSPAGDIAPCLRHVAAGRSVLPPGWDKALAAGRTNPVNLLSNRQLEVLNLLADGYSYEQIGARLSISLNTVKFHVRSIFVRLGVRNRMAAARLLSDREGVHRPAS